VYKPDTLYIRCSDGRTRRPSNIHEHCVHQIRQPGGILNPDYKEKFFTHKLENGVLQELLMFDIAEMVKLKAPHRIIIASHNHCGAGQALGLTLQEIKARHQEWGQRLRERFPNIPVEVLHEKHSECGLHYDGHEEISDAA
jgi:carbonic anhydrase